MTTETLNTDAATTTEGEAVSQVAAEAQAPEATQQPEDQQPEAAKADDGKKPEGAPEQYADFTFEEGVSLAEDLADDIKATAKELNLTQEHAQKLADLAAKRTTAAQSKQADEVRAVVERWEQESRADPELGGANFEANLAIAKKARDAFFDADFVEFLNESGLGNHPAMMRGLYRAGKAISEDRIVTGQASKPPAGDARNLYSASNMNP